MGYKTEYQETDIGDLLTGSRVCIECKTRQPVSNFQWTARKAHRVRKCTECQRIARVARKANKPVDTEAKYGSHLRRTYGITLETFKELLAKQHGMCAICAVVIDTTQSNKAHVDHCHKSGEVRGILCFTCNTAIGKLRDDPVLLRKAADYLEADKPLVVSVARRLTPEELSEARRTNALKQWKKQLDFPDST